MAHPPHLFAAERTPPHVGREVVGLGDCSQMIEQSQADPMGRRFFSFGGPPLGEVASAVALDDTGEVKLLTTNNGQRRDLICAGRCLVDR